MHLSIHISIVVAALGAATTAVAQQPFQLDPQFQVQFPGDAVGSLVVDPNNGLLISGSLVFPDMPFLAIPRLNSRLLLNGARDPDYLTSTWGGGS